MITPATPDQRHVRVVEEEEPLHLRALQPGREPGVVRHLLLAEELSSHSPMPTITREPAAPYRVIA